MAQLTGIAFIKVDGALVQSKPGAKIKFGGKKRKPQTGHTLYGFTEEVEPAEVDLTIFHSFASAEDIEKFRAAVAAVILFETDTGVTYQVSNAFLMETPELTDGEGEVSLKFAGMPAEKQ